jgi:uncharacterized protein (TIGR00730 family)
MKRICIFCGASQGSNPAYIEAAIELTTLLAERNIGIVYGGASVGVMGALADAALDRGVEIIGVMPKILIEREVSHSRLSQLIVVNTMHERKAKMADLADGFIALPGGLGTLEELFEILTWSQLRLHSKPCGLLNYNGYYTKLLKFLDYGVQQQFIKSAHRELLLSAEAPKHLLDKLLGVADSN